MKKSIFLILFFLVCSNITAGQAYFEVIRGIYLKANPDAYADNLIFIPSGKIVKKDLSSDNPYIRITYNGEIGYVSMDDLKDYSKPIESVKQDIKINIDTITKPSDPEPHDKTVVKPISWLETAWSFRFTLLVIVVVFSTLFIWLFIVRVIKEKAKLREGKENLDRQRVARERQDELDRQRVARERQDELDRQRVARERQDELDRQRMARERQDELDRQRMARERQDELDRQRVARERQDELDRQRVARERQDELDRQRVARERQKREEELGAEKCNLISCLSADTPFRGIYHLCYYIPNHKDSTEISRHVLDFKDGKEDAVKKWIDTSVKELKKLNVDFKFIARALGSSELEFNAEKPLHRLGKELAVQLSAEFLPQLIHKNKVTTPLKNTSSAAERRRIVNDAYKVRNIVGKRLVGNILFIDDITTSGATANIIGNKIIDKHPDLIPYQFTIAKTIRDKDANSNISSINF
jgi:hypothetical protein